MTETQQDRHVGLGYGGVTGACPGFLKGGSNISWFPKKRSSDFKRGGVQWSDGGGDPVHLSH